MGQVCAALALLLVAAGLWLLGWLCSRRAEEEQPRRRDPEADEPTAVIPTVTPEHWDGSRVRPYARWRP